MEPIKLTQYSHGAGCGCKISPQMLGDILHTETNHGPWPKLLVGNETRDDAAVYDLDGERVIISTTDFFMPIVDDPRDFGGIASVNAISDVYAMGGTPIMALAVLGWPVDKIPAEIARLVLEGAREACSRAGIPLAGGHSIDAPEPIFGLAVTGTGLKKHVKSNDKALPGCELYLTKPLGIGIFTTAQKRGILPEADLREVTRVMLRLNSAGTAFGKIEGVRAMTDVTGFGLLGHLVELCQGSGVSAEIWYDRVPRLPNIEAYLARKIFPGGSRRNLNSYGHLVGPMNEEQQMLLCDPQTSGGLLVAVEPEAREYFFDACRAEGLGQPDCIGLLRDTANPLILVK
jgi:selenide, water dikinase